VSAPAFHGRLRAGDGAAKKVDVRLDGERLHGTVDGAPVDVTARRGGGGHVVLEHGGRVVRAVVARSGDRWLVAIDGRVHEVARVDGADDAAHAAVAEPFAVSPMTGVLAKVFVKAGDAVAKGAPLFAVEAMKMEYVVKAERDVVIDEVKVVAGGRVTINEPGVTFAAGAAS
jgi:propionyl-CoA carboxylase alpha chain